MNTMRNQWHGTPKFIKIIGLAIIGLLGITALGFIFGFVLMLLWNSLMPELFGLKTITYWQGIGLFILARILLGGFGGDKSSSHSNNKRKEKAKKFTYTYNSDNKSDLETYETWWESEGKAAFEKYTKNN